MSDVVALIPARSGSKGVPGKNVRLLGGRPLIAWTIEVCRRAKMVDRVIVSTDSPGYAAVAKDLGAEVPFLRPAELATDKSSDLQFVTHCLDWLAAKGEEPALVAHMRPTTPLRDPVVVDEAIQMFSHCADTATCLRSVEEMVESAYKTFEVGDGYLRMVGTRDSSIDAANEPRQSFPKTYCANGYVDVLSVAYIRSSGRIHGDRAIPFVTPPAPEIDCEDDFMRLEHRVASEPTLLQTVFA